MNSAQAVAGEVRANLARARISGRQAALRLGWTPPYLSRRLIGEIPFDVADLQAIADLLGLPITVFFETPLGVASGPQVRKSAKPDYLLAALPGGFLEVVRLLRPGRGVAQVGTTTLRDLAAAA